MTAAPAFVLPGKTYPTFIALRERMYKAREAWDLDTAYRMIQMGAAFANFSIRTPTETAEKLLRRWLDKGRPTSMEGISDQLRATREKRLMSVALLGPSGVADLLGRGGSPHVEQRFMAVTWGYGPAKASFAMACAGLGTMPCLDRRMIRKHWDKLQPFIRGKNKAEGWNDAAAFDNWHDYTAAVDVLYPGDPIPSDTQAIEWLTDLVRERYATQHEILLGEPSPQLELFA